MITYFDSSYHEFKAMEKFDIVLGAPRGQSEKRSVFVLPGAEMSLAQEGITSHWLCGKIYFITCGGAFSWKFWHFASCLCSLLKREQCY